MNKKAPRFFCDNCGCEVGHEVKACPHCGRFFASVRCPSCDFTGVEKMFLNGCPMCGYSASLDNSGPSKRRRRQKNRREYSSSGVSFWTFFFAFIALIAVVLVLSWLITR